MTFLHYSDVNIIFPGDLTEQGWQKLLQHPEFVEYLEKVNLFVASNHGQKIGYCADVFKHCHPHLVIISNDIDHPITEEMTKLYASHAKGLPVDQANRQLLMTHRDGRVNISRYLDRRLEISTEPFYRN